MKELPFFAKLLCFLVAACFLTAFLCCAVNAVSSVRVTVERSAEELYGRAQTLSVLCARYVEGGVIYDMFYRFLAGELRGVHIYVFDSQGTALLWSEEGNDSLPGSRYAAIVGDVLSGSMRSDSIHALRGEIAVAVPLTDSLGRTEGAVVLVRQTAQVRKTIRRLTGLMLLSAAVASLLMTVPAVFASRAIAKPIKRISTVAAGMGSGDFSQRLEETGSMEIAELAANLNRMAEKLSQLEQTRRDYVANVSHELRTPIASIRSLAETLNDGIVTDESERERYYGYILRESSRMSTLIDDLLELSRLQSGSVALERSPFDLSALLKELTEDMALTASYSGIGLTYAENTIPFCDSNADRIRQVLVALIDNAVKYAPDDTSVKVAARAEGARIRVTVRNEGHIDEADLPHLFERFYKADKAHTGNGTGLGLAIAKEIVTRLGGIIGARNDREEVEFYMELPAAHCAGGETMLS